MVLVSLDCDMKLHVLKISVVLAVLAAVLFATYPLWVTILAHLLLPDEPWTWREGLGTLVGFAGVATILLV